MAKRKFAKIGSKILEEIKEIFLKQRKTWGKRPEEKEFTISGNQIVFSSDNFDDTCITPDGLFDGDMPCREKPFIPLHEIELVDICGNPISSEKLYSGDFHPDNIRFNKEPDCDDEFDFVDDDYYPELWENYSFGKEVFSDSVIVNGEMLTEELAEDIWYRNFFDDPLEESLYFEEIRTKLAVEDRNTYQKMGSMSPQISSMKEGFCWAYLRIRPKACWKKKYLSRGGQIDEKKEIPENDRHKDHRVKISPRQAEKINEFFGKDFCCQTLFPQRVFIVVSQELTKEKEKICPSLSLVQITDKPEKEKIPKKRENNGYFNRPSTMRR